MQHGHAKPYFSADLGVSVRKVSNGYSIKVNHSVFKEDLGKIIVSDSTEGVLDDLRALFEKCEKAPESSDRGFYGTDCGDPDTEPD